jgi:hypothetical protein
LRWIHGARRIQNHKARSRIGLRYRSHVYLR